MNEYYYKIAARLAEADDMEAYNAFMHLLGMWRRINIAQFEAVGLPDGDVAVMVDEGKDVVIREMALELKNAENRYNRLTNAHNKLKDDIEAVYKIVREHFPWDFV